MTISDETSPDPLDARIEIINDAMHKVVSGLQAALAQDREPTKQECIEALHGVATLAASAIAGITEIAHSVGILATIAEKDFNASVTHEAETLADIKQKETAKRSFIGQPKNNG